MAKVFVSYSRKDIEFAKRLTGELQKSDMDFWIDWEGIPPTVDWWKEIETGIEEADIFLFLISPDSAKSKVCGQEIDTAVKNAKRIIPLVVREIAGDEAPHPLRHLNWIFFRENDDFAAALQKLLTGIHTDYDWVRVHRRLQVKALEWDRSSRDPGFLLRGRDLGDAELQLATNSSKEPHPTDLQRAYVFESRKATDRQRRIITGFSIIGAIALLVLTALSVVSAGQARSANATAQFNEQEAKTQAAAAQLAQQTAVASGKTAVANANSAATSEANAIRSANNEATARVDAENALIRVQSVSGLRAEALASLSRDVEDRDHALALLLAIEAYDTTPDGATTSRLLELLGEELVVQRFRSRDEVYVAAFNPQGNRLAVGYNNGGDIIVWPVLAPTENETVLSGHGNAVYGLAFSPNGDVLASGSWDWQVRLWDVGTDKEIGQPLNAFDRVFTVAFSPDGKWLASAGDDNRITVWDAATKIRREPRLQGHINTVYSLAFSPDGKLLISGGKDSTLIFWDAKTLQKLEARPDHRNFIYSMAFSPDSKTVASADEGGKIIFWNAETHQPLGSVLASSTKRISTVSFSPDGNWLASGGYDGQVILWDVHTRQQFTRLPIEGGSEVYSVAFSPDGALLAVGDKSGTVTLWNLQPSFWLERACAGDIRNLTEAEWKQYFPGETYRKTCD